MSVGGYDAAQDIRTATMNRVRDVVRKKNEGIPFDQTEDEKEDRDYDAKYQDDNLPDFIEEMRDEGQLTDREYDYISKMLDAANAAISVENRYENVMAIAQAEPIFSEWLTDVYGVGVILTAKLLHRFGYCKKFDRVSQLWSYTGLAPGQERKEGEQLGYDPDAKTLAWNVADCMIKQGANSEYRLQFYDPYKEKQVRRMERAEDMTEAELENVKWTPPESQGHADARARRYLAKKFLKHYWAIARDLKGLETPDEWVITHGGHEKQTETFENPFHARRVLGEAE